MHELEWSQAARGDLLEIVSYIAEEEATVRILRVLHAARQWPPDR